jgi:4-amino-4-deoxy-L-arabinose transferase-like glycosyltransferase
LALADAQRGPPRWLLKLRPGVGILVMLAVTLPWFVAIGLRTGGTFFAQSLGTDLAGKVAVGDDGHGGFPGWHLLLLSMTAFPSGCVILPALPVAWRARNLPAIRFLLAWAVPSWLVFEAVPTKLPHYTLPLLPALCLLGAAWALDQRPSPLWLRWTALVATILAASAFGLGATALPAVVEAGLSMRDLLGIPALLAAAFIIWLLTRRGYKTALMATPLLIWAVIGFELPALPAVWIAPRVEAILRAQWPHGVTFAAAGFAEPSLVFLCGTDTALLAKGEDAAHFLTGPPPRAVLVDLHELAAFTATARQLGLTPQPIAEIGGYNYSRGRRVRLQLFGKS